MKKNYLIVILVVAVLILAGAAAWIFLQKQETVQSEEVVRPGAEEDFYSYLKLPSHNGKFLEFDEAESEISIIYFDIETMKVYAKTFKIDKDTIFSKATPGLYHSDLFPKKDLKNVRQETPTTIFYLPAEKENEVSLARLIQVETSF